MPYWLRVLAFSMELPGVLNVAHGEFIMLGAMATYSLYIAFGINPLISLSICGPILFVIGFLIHRVLFGRLRRLATSIEMFEGNSILVTFGLLFLIQSVALLVWGPDLRGYSFLDSSVDLLGAKFAANRLVALLSAALIASSLYFFLVHTRIGKAIRGAAQDTTGAQVVGINIHWMYRLCFALGAALAGLAGGLMSMMFPVSPVMGFPYTIIAIIVVTLGGLGDIMGSLVGGLVLGMIASIMMYVEPSLSMLVYYLLFMFVLLVKPKGILRK